METIKNLILWLQGLSPFSRVLSVVIAALAAIIILFGCTSCGTTRAVVHTKDSGTATITITTNNPIDVSTTTKR